jgi:hypothetical protein
VISMSKVQSLLFPDLFYRPLVRIWHPWWLWEDHKAGFYDSVSGEKREEGVQQYAEFLGSRIDFERGLRQVTEEWKYACEHNLTCLSMNRIAYLGQASMCLMHGVPSCCRSGFMLLDAGQRQAANELAAWWLHGWLEGQGYEKENQRVCRNMESSRVPRGSTRLGSRLFDATEQSSFIQGNLFRDS